MPKILYFIAEDWFFVSHFLLMARTARQEGFDVVVATRVGEHGHRITSEGFRLIALDSDRKSLQLSVGLRDLLHAHHIIRQEKPDIVHCIALRLVFLAGIAAKL